MADREPVDVTNLDRYGGPELPWSRARDVLAAGPPGPEVTFGVEHTMTTERHLDWDGCRNIRDLGCLPPLAAG